MDTDPRTIFHCFREDYHSTEVQGVILGIRLDVETILLTTPKDSEVGSGCISCICDF